MTKHIGRPLACLLLAGLLLLSVSAQAVVEATVDRARVAMGDTLRLTISATEDNEDISSVDLSPVLQNFEILQRSTKSSTSIVNGSRTHSRQLLLEITPLRAGALVIPALPVGASTTRPVQILVSDAAQIDPGSETVLFEAELDREQVYVQGQLILTLRLQQAVNLDSRSISELQLPDAFVIPLEQQSFQRTVNGRAWLVHEVRYAIFPEQSGTLEIPAQSFSARESKPRRSLFDSSNRGRLVRRETPAMQVSVLARPDNYPAGASWLPARELSLQESWSTDPAQLRAGESVTRIIELRGEGVQGAQLPPVSLSPVDGLKYYPDQPSISDAEISSGLTGTRRDSTAIVATRPGSMQLPEVRIPWWDSEAGELRFAVLPARTLQIAAAEVIDIQPPAGTASANASNPFQPGPVRGGSLMLWQALTLFCAIGWLFTLYFLLKKSKKTTVATLPQADNPSLRKSYKQLLAACASDSPIQARQAVIEWSSAMAGNSALTSVELADRYFNDHQFSDELASLERALYSSADPGWDGGALASVVQRLQKEQKGKRTVEEETLSLYPTAG